MPKILVIAHIDVDDINYSIDVDEIIYKSFTESINNNIKIEDMVIYDDLLQISIDTLNNELQNIFIDEYKEFTSINKTKSKKKFIKWFWLNKHIEFNFMPLYA